MILMKIYAVLFAVLVISKVVLLVFARDFLFQMSEKLPQDRKRALIIYGVGVVIVGLPVLLSINIVEVAAVMLLTSLLVGLGMLPYGDLLAKHCQELKQVGLEKIWWVIGLWVVLAIWILYAVFA
jgi:hypothetical protein